MCIHMCLYEYKSEYIYIYIYIYIYGCGIVRICMYVYVQTYTVTANSFQKVTFLNSVREPGRVCVTPSRLSIPL